MGFFYQSFTVSSSRLATVNSDGTSHASHRKLEHEVSLIRRQALRETQ
eukprot:IDg16067t1